jgi:hypothetical protein
VAFLVRGQASSPINPVLDLFTSLNGVLTDVAYVAFQVFDLSTPQKQTDFYSGNENATQVFPSPPGTKFILDVNHLTTDPTPGHKLSTGHYYAPWQASAEAGVGNWVIRWYYKQLNASPEKIHTEEFTIVSDGSAVTTGTTVLEKLKWYMQDYFEKNELLDKVQYQDYEYQNALEFSAMRFNVIPVMTNFQVENFPVNLLYFLLMGAAGHLLRSTSIEQLRNQLSYTDGNVHVGLTDKHQFYLSVGASHLAEFDQMVRYAKNQMNNEAAWGDADSPYMAPFGGWGQSGGGWGWA